MTADPRVVSLGDSALLVEFENRIDGPINERCIALAEALEARRIAGVRDIVPAYRTVAVYFDPLKTDSVQLRRELDQAIGTPAPAPAATARRRVIRVPVCYGAADGPDIGDVASFAGRSEDDVVALHTTVTYRVFMLGFSPGFAYMGPVDARIAAPRRATPRTAVPAGSVGIAGQQTGIYPSDTPGGWQLVGRTPLRVFDAGRTAPSLFRAGDTVQFFAIDRDQWDRYA
jgi:KipI family sensor histidine kinase inhibitor